jgi:hypothetical protein
MLFCFLRSKVKTDFSVEFASQSKETTSISSQLSSALAQATISPPAGVEAIQPSLNAVLSVSVVANLPKSFGAILKAKMAPVTAYLLIVMACSNIYIVVL